MALFIELRGFTRHGSQLYSSPFLTELCNYSSRTLLGRYTLAKGVITLADDGLVITSLNFSELSQEAQLVQKILYDTDIFHY